MPIYTFRNKETDEVFTEMMKMSERETYLQNNPHVEQEITPRNIVDPVSIGVKRPPVDFQKHVLGRVKAMPGADKNKIEKRWTVPKEV
jgi:hypothetical protein